MSYHQQCIFISRDLEENRQEAIWRGNLRIVARGTELSIRALAADDVGQ